MQVSDVSGATGMAGHLQAGPTASRPTYRLVQMLRGAAALMVVLHHETLAMWDRLHLDTLHHNWVNGGSGVDIFFVISGFVMTISSQPLRNSAHPARIFLARRLERVVPLYWLLTTVKVLLVLAVPTVAVNGLGSTWHVLASYLFLPAYNRHGSAEPVLVVGWTLNFEMAFYMVFAVALALRAELLAVVAPTLLGFVAFAAMAHGAPWQLRWLGNPLVLEFLFGMLLGYALKWVRRLPWFIALAMGAAGAVPLLLWVSPNFSQWRALGWGVPAAAVVCSAVALEPWLGPTAPRWFLEIGDGSYSLYLVHGFVIPAAMEVLAHIGTHWKGVVPVSLLAMLVLATLAGEAVYRLIERPMVQWFKGRRKTAIPANA